ncbi:cupin domain-containing protein [Mycobacteroides saopaulense]|uniref:Cupin n=1 Tax=Mycobacteroides saopaulense TaxID=1578165 RepID=A0ABX3BWD6_9MYCO|nr:cupin domain-containing protein [Mycobacteroides saopaulense]OHT81155.1 cupin [Mycobacteroides saopaulense]OHU07303.1 cupin [Mycobacteroides saopaulense]
MSLIVSGYPEPRYHGDTGEISATFRPATDPPDYAPDGGDAVRYSYLATQQSTAGDYGLYRIDAGPVKGFGAATHFHKAMSEAFFVLSGAWRLYNGQEWVDATAGDFLFVPPGGLHAFQKDSGEAASMLMLFAPGAPRQRYFEGFGELADMTDEQRTQWFIDHDNFFV